MKIKRYVNINLPLLIKMKTSQELFIFTVSQILLIQFLILLGNETIHNIYNLKMSVINWYVLVYIFFIVMFQYAIVSGNKKYLELPHLWMVVALIVTSILFYDKRVLFINIVLLILTILSRLIYKDCPVDMAGNDSKTFIPEFLVKNIVYFNFTVIYFLLLVLNMYKIIK